MVPRYINLYSSGQLCLTPYCSCMRFVRGLPSVSGNGTNSSDSQMSERPEWIIVFSIDVLCCQVPT